MLKTAILFQNGMILQRDKNIVVWGSADPDALISVTIQGKTSSTNADNTGNWKLVCGPLSVSFMEEMRIISSNEEIVLSDIQIGDVWLAGGQSNMEFYMRYDADMDTERGICCNHNIRFFDYPEVSYVGQIDEADFLKHYGIWRKAEPDQLERFSAVAYYFAKDLQNKYNIPIGIIGCNWGGTPACAWMSKEAILEGGGQVYIEEYEEAVKGLDIRQYEKQFKANPVCWRTDQFADPIGELMMFGCTMEDFQKKMAEMGINLSETDISEYQPLIGPKYERRPSGLYESMLKPIVPYAIKGIIWYQGETDGDCHPELYQTLFPALIRNWRKLWNEQLPFLFVQIAPLEQWGNCFGDNYVEIRKAQQHTADTVPNTGMAVITDSGMQFDIHPKNKRSVGHRLALLAENYVYKEDVLCEAPRLIEAILTEEKISLRFLYSGSGLYLKSSGSGGENEKKERLSGLRIIQDRKKLNEDKFVVSVSGDKVVISSTEIKAGNETIVEIAYTGWHQVNLYNSAGIPARPVRLLCSKL